MITLLNGGNDAKCDYPFPHPPWEAKSFRMFQNEESGKGRQRWFMVVSERSWKTVL